MDLLEISAAVWLDAGQEALAREVASLAGLRVEAAGCPEGGRAGVSGGDVARVLGASRTIPDLRSALCEAGAGLDVRCVLVLSRKAIGARDLAGLVSAHQRRVLVASIEPAASRLGDLAEGSWAPRAGTARPLEACRRVGRFRECGAMRHARDAIASFGAIETMWVRCEGTRGEGSLGSRLVDALETLHDLLGVPETVFAGAHLENGSMGQGENGLCDLTGDVSVVGSYAQGVTAGVWATDRAGAWRRELSLIGPSGQMSIRDGSFVWTGPDGGVRDEWTGGTARDTSAAGVIAQSILRAMDPHTAAEAPVDPLDVLSSAHASLLAIRTRSAESPSTIRRMLGPE